MNARALGLTLLLVSQGVAAEGKPAGAEPPLAAAKTPTGEPEGDLAEPPPSGDAVQGRTEAAVAPDAREKAAAIAMQHYEVGEVEVALTGLRVVIGECLAEDGRCEPKELASYFGQLAIVLASDLENPQAAVVAWRKALDLNPELEVPPEYRTPKVVQAYDEARGVPVDSAPKPSPLATAVASARARDPAQSSTPEPAARRLFVLGSGTASGGAMTSSIMSLGVLELGVSATVGGRLHPSKDFVMGLRGRGGAQVQDSLMVFCGLTALAGALIPSGHPENFGYVMGGPGAKMFFTGGVVPHPAIQILGGVSWKGLNLGASLDYSYGVVGYLVSYSSGGYQETPISGHVFQLGIELGAGFLL